MYILVNRDNMVMTALYFDNISVTSTTGKDLIFVMEQLSSSFNINNMGG